MKTQSQRSLPVLSLAALAFALLGCPETTARNDTPLPGGPALTAAEDKDLEKLRSYSFAQRADFDAAVRSAVARLDAQIAALSPAPVAGAPAGGDAAKAREDLQSARAILDERIGKIEQAVPENWESVRNEVLTALGQAQSAFARAART